MKRPSIRKRKRRGTLGFTLVEMATVTAIVSSIPAGAYMKAKKKAYQTECLNNQRQIAMMLNMHMMADDAFPRAAFYPADINGNNSIYKILRDQGDTSRIMVCPGLPDELQKRKLNFVYNDTLAGKRAPSNAAKEWVMTEFTCVSSQAPKPHINGWNIIYADGHIETTTTLPQVILDKRAEVDKL